MVEVGTVARSGVESWRVKIGCGDTKQNSGYAGSAIVRFDAVMAGYLGVTRNNGEVR